MISKLDMPDWLYKTNTWIDKTMIPRPICLKTWPWPQKLFYRYWWAIVMRTLRILGVWGKKKLPARTANTPGNVTNVDEGNVNERNSKP